MSDEIYGPKQPDVNFRFDTELAAASDFTVRNTVRSDSFIHFTIACVRVPSRKPDLSSSYRSEASGSNAWTSFSNRTGSCCLEHRNTEPLQIVLDLYPSKHATELNKLSQKHLVEVFCLKKKKMYSAKRLVFNLKGESVPGDVFFQTFFGAVHFSLGLKDVHCSPRLWFLCDRVG